MRSRTVVTVNSTGRQAASFVRVASAVGWQVRAQTRDRIGLVAAELEALPNVTIFEGPLEDDELVDRLFEGADLAFINTTHWGDEVKIGKRIADAAKRAGVKHYVYSSMPDHGVDWEMRDGRSMKSELAIRGKQSATTTANATNGDSGGRKETTTTSKKMKDSPIKGLPMWSTKHEIEQYVRRIGLPATFIYTAIYHNNFTSLSYPLFQLELQGDGSFEWEAPFDPNTKLPWLDAEHDVGPSVLQIFLEGPKAHAGEIIPLAFELLTPLEVCQAFSVALQRRVEYSQGPITYKVPVPAGYKEHLAVLEETLIKKRAPYWGSKIRLEDSCTKALNLWEGNRSMEEYAREVFPVEEANNGLTWMLEDEASTPAASEGGAQPGYTVGC